MSSTCREMPVNGFMAAATVLMARGDWRRANIPARTATGTVRTKMISIAIFFLNMRFIITGIIERERHKMDEIWPFRGGTD
ncbi:MAG TPA: hypothetical protein PK528_09250 [Syntrophorhabdus sp.]|nr:hypothetical protein [Syntrophorhabdus sp.]